MWISSCQCVCVGTFSLLLVDVCLLTLTLYVCVCVCLQTCQTTAVLGAVEEAGAFGSRQHETHHTELAEKGQDAHQGTNTENKSHMRQAAFTTPPKNLKNKKQFDNIFSTRFIERYNFSSLLLNL